MKQNFQLIVFVTLDWRVLRMSKYFHAIDRFILYFFDIIWCQCVDFSIYKNIYFFLCAISIFKFYYCLGVCLQHGPKCSVPILPHWIQTVFFCFFFCLHFFISSLITPPLILARFYWLLYVTWCKVIGHLLRNNPCLSRYFSSYFFREKETQPHKSFNFSVLLFTWKETKLVFLSLAIVTGAGRKSQVFEQHVGNCEPKAASFRVFDLRGDMRVNFE